ncbi:MAG TPA: lytic transglycosylase domain-containing protein [Pyrinomonadaceae bacterium]|nr:lytic transglycosylase domain-containing protein [Pyrinomonadaceae bacterium]
MQITRHVPHFRSIKASVLTLFALFVAGNFSDISLFKAVAPTVSAQAELLNRFVNPPDYPTSGDAKIDELIYRAGQQHGLDPRLLHAVILQESRYKPNAESYAGAQGLMQLMPAAAKRFKCEDRKDPQQNIEAGAKYLRWLLKRFDGDVKLALAGYNAGEGAVDKYEGIPPYEQTQTYVKKIVANYGKTSHPVLKPEEARAAFGLTQRLAELAE